MMNSDLRGGQGFKSLSSMMVLKQYAPYAKTCSESRGLNRKTLDAPMDDGSFVKPVKQCFIKNPRLMPGTRLMLTLLNGWSGNGTSFQTTTNSIGKQLSRSRRQVFRYLQDAVEEGYIVYSKTKDRLGYITGIKIWLNFKAIRHTYQSYIERKQSEQHRKQAVTQMSEINSKLNYNMNLDQDLEDRLSSLAKSMGIEPDPDRQYSG